MGTPSSAATLTVFAGDGDWRDHTLVGRFTIGRSSRNDWVIDALDCSRHHAEIRSCPDGRFELVDLTSRNGCFVNGKRIAGRHVLADGDQVEIAEVRAQFRQGADESIGVVPRGPSGSATDVFGSSHADPVPTLDLEPRTVPDAGASPDAQPAAGVAGATAPEAEGAVRSSAPAAAEVPVVVLVADLAGLGELRSGPTASSLEPFCAAWLERAGALMRSQFATVERMGRTGLVAYWLIDHADRPGAEVGLAVRGMHALLSLRDEVAQGFAEQFDGAAFEVAIGLHTGNARLATAAARGGLTLAGDAVVVAAGLGGIAEEAGYAAVVSESIARSAPEPLRLSALGNSDVRDHGRPIQALALVS